MNRTPIEWADKTWNFIDSCSEISLGCVNCYAKRIIKHFPRLYPQGWGKPVFHPNRLVYPLLWKEPSMIFVNSMSDLFHEQVEDAWLQAGLEIMRKADWHIYQILTKRPARMLKWVDANGPIPPHIWLGTSVENASFLFRLEILKKVDCSTKFISFEPLLGRIEKVDFGGISWVITGGESDYKQPRPMKPDWALEIRNQCLMQRVPYFHKQNGGTRKCKCHNAWGCRLLDGQLHDNFPRKFQVLLSYRHLTHGHHSPRS